MKRNYIKPETLVVFTSQNLLLSGSPTGETFHDEDATGAALTHTDNSWDIWGGDDFDEDF